MFDKPLLHNDHPLCNDPRQVIKPLAALARSSVCDALVRLGATDDKGQPYAAAATVFVSHAWRYTFAQLLDAVSAFAEAQPEPAKVYLWLVRHSPCPRMGMRGLVKRLHHQQRLAPCAQDVLTVNQHSGEALPQAWWATAFKQGIGAIEHTCLVLAPWRAPVPMTRAWCLWELLCTKQGGARLTVQLPPAEARAFSKALVDDFDTIAGAIGAIDVRRAEAFDPVDLEMILRRSRRMHI